MPRAARSELPDFGVFHVTARGVDGCAIQRDDTDRHRFVRFLRLATISSGWRLLAYCLMANHFHLVVLCEREAMSRGVHLLSFRHAQAFNRRHDRRGHLFQDRFHAQVVRDDEHLAAACAYVFDNPVRAGLCAHADEYVWQGGELSVVEVPGRRLHHALAVGMDEETQDRIFEPFFTVRLPVAAAERLPGQAALATVVD